MITIFKKKFLPIFFKCPQVNQYAALGMLLALLGSAFSSSVLATAGQFGVIYSIDAPWRLEPLPGNPQVLNSKQTYGAIPITIMFRQALNEQARQLGDVYRFATGSGSAIDVGHIVSIQVDELVSLGNYAKSNFTTAALRDIERKQIISSRGNEPPHEFCRPSAANNQCANEAYISDTDEWHALLWYEPFLPVYPGRNISLIVTVRTQNNDEDQKVWRSSVVIHAGETKLPRFSDQWLYGDLHYHSQMTGNEGEYGYSYRNVVRTLGTMGLDFVFTTDHASDGEQSLGKIDKTYGCEIKNGQVISCLHYKDTAARDLNESRFKAAKSIIYDPNGANAQVINDVGFGYARLKSANILPQIYMGEEVDAMPEMSVVEWQEGFIHYGDGLLYPWVNVEDCLNRRSFAECQAQFSKNIIEGNLTDHRTLIVKDTQGLSADLLRKLDGYVPDWISTPLCYITLTCILDPDFSFDAVADGRGDFPARQHLLYFPKDATAASANGWVSSATGPYGGARKRLKNILGEINQQGFSFLAHPLINHNPGGPGPDVVPYSADALNVAWSSPAVLGLQFWNESFTRKAVTSVQDQSGPLRKQYELLRPFNGTQIASDIPPWKWDTSSYKTAGLRLYDAAFTWDRYLRKGLNLQETAALSWLTKGEPRKWFVAAGSDAHGDFNYRQGGEICDSRWCTNAILDAAIGKPRNLVRVATAPIASPTNDYPNAKRYANTQVIEALQSGSFTATDGPAIRIAIDKNRNGKFDDSDFPMGSTFDLYPGEQIPLLVEWYSTAEFGPLQNIDLYVGNQNTTYAPANHGPYIPIGYKNGLDDIKDLDPSLKDPTFGQYHREYGAYTPDPSGSSVLKIDLSKQTTELRLHGRAAVFLAAGKFGIHSTLPNALFYIRAFAKTRVGSYAPRLKETGAPRIIADAGFLDDCKNPDHAGESCGNRMAYSNPIWGRKQTACPVKATGVLTPNVTKALDSLVLLDVGILVPSLDGDLNGVPDVCEKIIPDPCKTTSGNFRDEVLAGNITNVSENPTAPGSPNVTDSDLSCQKLLPFLSTDVTDIVGTGTVSTSVN